MRISRSLLALLLVAVFASHVVGQVTRSHAKSAIQKGNELVAQGLYEQALKEYQRVTVNDGEDYATALYNTGVCFYELWQSAQAINFYELALQFRKGRYPRASYALGVALEDTGRLREAKAAYQQALITAQHDYPLASFRLGLFAANDGDIQGAATFFRKAINRPGDHLSASHNNLGVMLARMQRLNEAEKEFVLALRRAGGAYPDAAYNLSLCRRLLVNYPKNLVSSLKISNAGVVD